MKSKSVYSKKINHLNSDRNHFRPRRGQTLRELQLTFLNSLSKNPVVNLTKKERKSHQISKNILQNWILH